MTTPSFDFDKGILYSWFSCFVGLNVLTLEARDRVGGRTLTKEWNNTKIDLGKKKSHPSSIVFNLI